MWVGWVVVWVVAVVINCSPPSPQTSNMPTSFHASSCYSLTPADYPVSPLPLTLVILVTPVAAIFVVTILALFDSKEVCNAPYNNSTCFTTSYCA